MGCVCSHSERAIPINSPSKKQISTPLDKSTSLKSPSKANSELHRLDPDKNQNSVGIFAESFVIPSSTSRGRRNFENKESIKSDIPKVIVKGETNKDSTIKKDTSIKPNFDSVSSIDPKEIPYLSHITRARSNDSTVKEILPAFETRSSFTRASKPSIFLSPSFFSEKTMNKIGTTGEGFHLNLPKSNDDFSMTSLRFDSHRGGLLFGEKEKGKENAGTNLLSPRKFLLVVPEQTDSYVETRVMNRIDSNDNNILEGIEENSSTRDKFGDTTRDQDREKAEKGNGGFGRLDSMDPNVRPWVSGNVPKSRKSSSISGKGYKISVNDSSFDKPRPPKKKQKIPQIKLNEDNLYLDPHFNRKGLNTSLGSPKAGLQRHSNDDEGFQLTLHIPSTAVSNTNTQNTQNTQITQNKAKTEDANSDSTPQSNKTGSNTARKDFPKVEVTHVEHSDNDPLLGDKGELMQNFIKTKVTVNLLDVILKKPRLKNKKNDENDQNKQGPNASEKAALETTITLKKKVSETSSVKMGHLNDTVLSSQEKLKPLDLQKLDLFNVGAGNDFSPISRQLQYTGNSTPGNSKMDSSFLKPMTVVTYDNPNSAEDRISCQEEGISYLDLEKYNYVGSQEIDASPMNLHPHRPPKISAFGAKKIVYNKSKSVNFDEQMPLEKPKQFLDLPKTHIQEANDNTGRNSKQALLSPFYESRNSYETANSMKDVSFIAQLPVEEKRKIFSRHRPKSQVIETDSVNKSVDEGGQKKINQYALGRELGRGTFGKVKFAIDTNTQKQYAIKIINKAKLQRKVFAKNKTAYTQIQAEIAIMTKMEHPNIVKLFEVIDAPDEDKLYLVMELVEKGAVMTQEFFSKNKGNYVEKEIETAVAGKITIKCLTENTARKYFRDLVLGIDYMHNYANVIHRDIKPENLLIGQDDCLKLSDFNIAHMVNESNDIIKTKGGTRHFLAPEAWISDSFRGRPLDIWAAGATLYYFLYGTPPFPTTNPSELKRKIIEEEPLFPKEAGVSEGAINLIKACLTKNVEQRITLDEIFEDPWLTENGKDNFNNEMFKVVEINAEDIRKALNVKFQTAMLVATGLVRSLHTARKTLTSMQLDSLIMDKNDENDK